MPHTVPVGERRRPSEVTPDAIGPRHRRPTMRSTFAVVPTLTAAAVIVAITRILTDLLAGVVA